MSTEGALLRVTLVASASAAAGLPALAAGREVTPLGPLALAFDAPAAELPALRAAAEGIDVLARPAGRSGLCRLMLCDMESTIICEEMLDILGERLGIGADIAAITRRAMNGELDFEAAFRARVALLEGLPEAELTAAAAAITLSPGAATLVRTMKGLGATSVLVTGGFTPFTTLVAAQLGFDALHGNALEVRDGRLTGRPLEPVRGPGDKLAVLRRLATELAVPPEAVLAIGDGANDIPMLEAAGLGLGWRPKPAVRRAIANVLDYADLTAALHAQGLAAGDFVP